jgi:CRP-like cAMP-binding protein
MIKTNYYQNSVELLNLFSNSIKYIFLPAKQIIFKYGENADNSFIILKGKVNVLTPLEIKIMMSEDEYFLYLSKLINNDEQGLIRNCIHANYKVFPFDYNENSNNTKSKISRRKLINKNINLDDNTLCIPNNFTLEYIENSKPIVRENQSVIKKEVKIWIYLDAAYLKTGDFYEFSSLNQVKTSYNATLITQEDCHLGYMNKQTFRNCVRESSEIKNNDLLNFLLSTEIFRKLTEKYFKSHYLNFFEEIKINKHNKILVEGQDSSEIYFIKDGELEISLRMSLCEINNYIMYLGGEIQEEIDEENFMMKSSSNRYYKYMTEKNLYRVTI